MEGKVEDQGPKVDRCSRCGGASMAGNLRDSRGLREAPEPQTWMPRMPQGDSFLSKMVAKGAASAQGLQVLAFRCLDCGHIDLFAPR